MEKEYYHLSVKFNVEEQAYKKLLHIQESMLDPVGKKYPLTSILKMALISFSIPNDNGGK